MFPLSATDCLQIDLSEASSRVKYFCMENTRYYIYKIKEELSQRQKINPLYSLRTYARDLGIHPSTLSQVLKGNRTLPLKYSSQVFEKLNLGPKEKTLFMESFLKTKTNIDDIKIDELDQRFMLDESYYKIISEWEHYAVLDLFDLKDFTPTLFEIKERLNLTETRAEIVINNLLTAKLLKMTSERKLKKVHEDIKTTEDTSSQALRQSHKETMEMGMRKLEEIDITLRDYSSATFAIDINKLPEAKTIIREFRQKMTALLREGDKTEVYQLAIQFFPLTKTKNQKN